MLLIFVDVGCRIFFFFKQKTAYEMRISDWSSDVCSSDGILGLVGLQLADQMQFNSRISVTQCRPFTLRLLNAVFAETLLPRLDKRHDLIGGLRLGNGERKSVV